MNMMEILRTLAVPRPNHGDAAGATAGYIKTLLTARDIPFSVQEFPLSPYFMLIMAITLLLMAALFTLAVIRKKPLIALALALAIPALLVLEYELFVPVVTWLSRRKGENIIIQFNAARAARELIFCAHYDSKTDFWDHVQRARIYMLLPYFLPGAMLLALWTFLARKFEKLRTITAERITAALALLFTAYISLVSLGFGGFVLLPDRMSSPGFADNAGSVTVLLSLADELRRGVIRPGASKITILLTGGEEVNLQGSHHYVQSRLTRDADKNAPPAFCVNLELAGQNGDLFHAAKHGVFLKYYSPSGELITRLGRAWRGVSGKDIVPGEKITDDAQRFLSAGIPAVTIGHTGLPGKGTARLHCNEDSLDRIDPKNLALLVKALGAFIEGYDAVK